MNLYYPKTKSLFSEYLVEIRLGSTLTISAVLLLFILFTFQSYSFSQQSKELFYVGTFSGQPDEGVNVYEFDRANSKLKLIQSVFDRVNPSYLELNPNGNYLYTVNRQGLSESSNEGSVSVFKINQLNGTLRLMKTVGSKGISPCHVSVDPKGRFLTISHYMSSHLSIFKIKKNGNVGKLIEQIKLKGSGPNLPRQAESHLHSAIINKTGTALYASDLGANRIYQIDIKEIRSKLRFTVSDTIFTSPGSGPRHLTISPNSNYAFSIEELSSSVSMYSIDLTSLNLQLLDRKLMIDSASNDSIMNTASDLVTSQDGEFLYASNRGFDNVVVYKIDQSADSLIQMRSVSSRGKKAKRNLYGSVRIFFDCCQS
ncbi:lactonase family protein [Algoriphagus sp. D3-2-R+10]|uniref:lactonase family protein n=1 Tax=Algoriphagus aurantiacus TaxID=3103948 RepID=UPI002B3B8588|nr:lactonase family protein [Algoriphagus sp. D3-2-R+10]MEB2777391.1 lactonase family protein [Algoriphagus sp. D3-2-R+10]